MASPSTSGPRTRQKSECHLSAFVGAPKEFSIADVPTNRAVIQRALLLRETKQLKGVDYRNYSSKEIASDLVPLVEAQWQKANVLFTAPVTVGRKSLAQKIERLLNRAINAAHGRGKTGERAEVENSLDRLFDIVICSHTIYLCHESDSGCPNTKQCKKGVHISCTCPRDMKVPVEELAWLHSQRLKVGERGGMQMSVADTKATRKYDKILENKAAKAEARMKMKRKMESEKENLKKRTLDLEDDDIELTEQGDEMEYEPPTRRLTREEECEVRSLVNKLLVEKLGAEHVYLVMRYLTTPVLKRNYMSITKTASESLRFEVSPAAAAAVASGFLKDLIAAGHLSEEMSYLAVDPSKLRRAREAVMSAARETEDVRAKGECIEAIYFDGRKDSTRTLVPDTCGRLHPKIIKEEHITVTAEPTGRYLSHFTPEPAVQPEKPAKKVAEGLYEVLRNYGATETCTTLGGDSYNGNTGWRGGTNAHLERMLGHKCHWSVCLIHTNELPLRHLIEKLDGKTSSKDGFTGEIGKLLSKVSEMELNPNFRALPGGEDLIALPEDVVKTLSTDACISYKYVQAVKTGILPPQLAALKPGPIVHSRWLTTGEALLMMWTREHGLTGEPLKTLELFVQFCLQFYFKLYFDIKVKHHLIDGPHHVLTQLRILRTLPEKVQNIVVPYVRTGAWYSHSECLLLSLLGSPTVADRKFAVDIIRKIRGNNELGDNSVRARKMPKLNLKATSLRNMIVWKVEEAHEPVFTCKFNTEELKTLVEKPFDVPKLSVTTVSTENTVKLVTEASSAVVGQERRDGYVRARVHSREEMPVFRTKKDIMAIF